MNIRILLTGKNGQVGHDLVHLLPLIGQVFALDRKDLDLCNPGEIRRVVRDIRPNLIVNAAAYTAVDRAESEADLARAINAEAPGVMATEAKAVGAALVHYSTDYVFNGLKTEPYVEGDPANPLNVYGLTKLEGERAVQNVGIPHLIFRTSWVYATRGKNFLLTMLRLATQREELRVVSDQLGAPVSSHEIALATTQVLAALSARGSLSDALSRASGIYHMTAGGVTNWCEFARAIVDNVSSMPRRASWLSGATDGRPILARRIVPIKTSEYPTPARRPQYSVLSNRRLFSVFGIQLPDWDVQLKTLMSPEAVLPPPPAQSLEIGLH
jgi:dTDP-4-dehydrorhamnose reductase